MDYTQMKFEDVLIADMGALPYGVRINKDVYDLLTMPYTMANMRSSLSIDKVAESRDSYYQIATTMQKGHTIATIRAHVEVGVGTAVIDKYGAEVRMKLENGSQTSKGDIAIKLKYSDYESSPVSEHFQKFLADYTIH